MNKSVEKFLSDENSVKSALKKPNGNFASITNADIEYDRVRIYLDNGTVLFVSSCFFSGNIPITFDHGIVKMKDDIPFIV